MTNYIFFFVKKMIGNSFFFCYKYHSSYIVNLDLKVFPVNANNFSTLTLCVFPISVFM